CGPVPPCAHGSSLSASAGQGSPIVYASGGQHALGGDFSLFEFLSQQVGPAGIAHILYEENLPASDLTVAPDLSSATVTTGGAKSFTGSLSFTATADPFSGPDACGGTYTVRQGMTTGGITGHFLAIASPAPVLGPSSFASTN
ncbi:MAG: hypothetical protein ACHQNA_08505, partial [Acidimicrobiales bacterium]